MGSKKIAIIEKRACFKNMFTISPDRRIGVLGAWEHRSFSPIRIKLSASNACESIRRLIAEVG
jgi:hypothetical protein